VSGRFSIKLHTFYETFNTFDLQTSSEKKEIFDKVLNSHEAWAEVVSNLNVDDINYVNVHHGIAYEIKSGANKSGKKINIFWFHLRKN
jgi:hypothetical protein